MDRRRFIVRSGSAGDGQTRRSVVAKQLESRDGEQESVNPSAGDLTSL